MNLFIETPQQRADRRELEERWRDRSHGAIEVPGAMRSAREAAGQSRYSLEQEPTKKNSRFTSGAFARAASPRWRGLCLRWCSLPFSRFSPGDSGGRSHPGRTLVNAVAS